MTNLRTKPVGVGLHITTGDNVWRVPFGLQLLPAGIMAFGLLTVKESPRWLASKGRYDEARISLARSRGIPVHEADENKKIHRELDDLRSSVEYEKGVKAGFVDCFKPERKQLYRTLLLMTLQMFQQLTGANYFFYVRTSSRAVS